MNYKANIFFIFSAVVFVSCLQAMSFAQNKQDPNNVENDQYKWIKNEKIRAGFLSFTDPVNKVHFIKEMGLNTIILKCWRFDMPGFRQETINSMKQWAKSAKANGIHLFVAINWQPYPKLKGIGYDLTIYEDGLKGVAVNPFDEKYWNEQINDIFILIANMSKQNDLQIDGIFLDMEIYGSEKASAVKKNYFEYCCGFGDRPFSRFLLTEGYQPAEFPQIGAGARKKWLQDNDLLKDYFAYLRNRMKEKAAEIVTKVRRINPDLILGIYPHPDKNNWVQYPLAKAFSSPQMPILIFATHSYGYYLDKNKDGYTYIPDNIKKSYRQDDINSLYIAGFLLRKYDATALKRNLYQTITQWDGYWLFVLRQLWGEDALGKLKDSEKNMIQVIKEINLKSN